MEEGHAPLWGHFSICPCLDYLELPCHSPAELFSLSRFKVWGNIQEPHHDITYLLVCTGNTPEDRHYGISLVWVNPNQARASTMEEAVETLTACPSSGMDWPYALAQLYKGYCHTPLPKDKHLGILPQGKAEETSCGQISQLEVCQLLSTSPQVIYSIGLNEHDEPIITTLPENYCQSVSLSGDWYPFTPHGGIRPQSTTYWWGLHHPVNQSKQISPKIRRQYGCRGQWPSISSCDRSIQQWIQTLPPGKLTTAVVLMTPPQKS